MEYKDFEKAVYDHLTERHNRENNFNFSVRKGIAGGPSNIFNGTEKDGLIKFSLWKTKGSIMGDLIGFCLEDKKNTLKIYLRYAAGTNPTEEQDKANLELGKIFKNKVGLIYELIPDKEGNAVAEILVYSSKDAKSGYNKIEELMNAVDEIINNLAPVVDQSIEEVKKIYPKWEISRITKEEFDKSIIKMNERIKNNQNVSLEPKEPKTPNNSNENDELNIILYGPPGTGKTYNSIDKAVEIIEGRKSDDHKKNKIRFDELRKEERIEFVTFHQNYSYEDFVVGIKPKTDGEVLTFIQNEGVFYKIAERARDNYYKSKGEKILSDTIDIVLYNILEPIKEGKEVEVKMVSGISFYIYDITDTSIHFRNSNGGTSHTLSLNSLKELVKGTKENLPLGLVSYYRPLVELIKQKINESNNPVNDKTLKKYVLIIDEINRANISRVFGELITLLEKDKRLGEVNELTVTLPNGQKDFGVPVNLYILGTMNTADKSIALVDIALRRRFHFEGYYPSDKLLAKLLEDGELIEISVKLITELNKKIYKAKGPDYLIGHAYFIGKKKEGEIIEVIKNKIIPLLNEYYSNKNDKIKEVFEKSPYEVKYNEESYEWEITTSS
ncbi:MAG: AAA family ATPase [Ignavibacteriae bacterium]|nr:AAA family ATPase [Ignavibacteriota bacterium]